MRSEDMVIPIEQIRQVVRPGMLYVGGCPVRIIQCPQIPDEVILTPEQVRKILSSRPSEGTTDAHP